MKLQGDWYKAESSTRHQATLSLHELSYGLDVNGSLLRQGSANDFTVSDRLGQMPRRLSWPDGAVFETPQNDELDTWLASVKHKGSRTLVLHRLESSWRWAIAGLLITIAVVFSGIRWGIPVASVELAKRIPPTVTEAVSLQTLKALDKAWFSESKISASRQSAVRMQFQTLLAELSVDPSDYELFFRQMNDIPNALALPGGQVIVTDAFLELVEHEDELNSVLLHEIGHVVQRHGLTSVIQASFWSVLLALAVGDAGAMGDLAIGLPIFVLQSSYSRQHETDADSFAFAQMLDNGRDPKHFAAIITRLTDTEFDEEADPDSSESSRQNYFATHPNSVERARQALRASRRLNDQTNTTQD
jgi:Zn-dependent protease with chaperone function